MCAPPGRTSQAFPAGPRPRPRKRQPGVPRGPCDTGQERPQSLLYRRMASGQGVTHSFARIHRAMDRAA